MKSSQSNFNLRSPRSYLARSYLIATVHTKIEKISNKIIWNSNQASQNQLSIIDTYETTSIATLKT